MAIKSIPDLETRSFTPDEDILLVHFVSKQKSKNIQELQKQLRGLLNHSIWLMPPENLHITICEIVEPKYTPNKDELMKNLDTYSKSLDQILNAPSFNVNFNQIEASQNAIILKAIDNDEMENLRNNIVENLPLPKETKLPPKIIHISIARFKEELSVNEINLKLKDIKPNFIENIKELQLLNNTAPHLNSYSIHKKYELI